MALSDLGLGFLIKAKDEASPALEKSTHGFGRLEKAAEHAGKSMHQSLGGLKGELVALATEAGALGGAWKLAEKADKFTTAIELTGMRAGATHHEIEGLRQAAWDAAISSTGLGTSVEGVGDTMQALAAEGLRANEVMGSFKSAMGLASISFGKLSQEDAAKTLASTLRQFHIEATRSSEVVDKLAVGMREFGMPAEQAAEAFKRVGLGVQAAGATFDDTLILLGLTRRELPSLEQATMSVNRTFMQLASTSLRKKLSAEFGGIKVDADGKLRPMIDILGDIAKKADGLGDAKLRQKMTTVFGPRGAGGLEVIVEALGKGIKTMTGETLKGAAAVDYLRGRIGDSAGASTKLRENLKDVLARQVTALKAAVSNLGVLIGEPFVKAFTPIVDVLRRGFVALERVLLAIPGPIKEVIAQGTIFVGVALAGVAAFKLLGAALPLLKGGVVSLAASFGSLLLYVAPLVLVGGALYLAWKKNLGGVADLVRGVADKTALAFTSLSQLFNQGWITESTWSKLSADDNKGVLWFVRQVWMWSGRLKNFFGGMWDTFTAGIERAEPTFRRLGEAFAKVGRALGLGSFAHDAAAAGQAFDKWGTAGRGLGDVLANVAEMGAGTLAASFEIVAGAITQLRADWPQLKQDFHEGVGTLKELASALGSITDAFGLTSRKAGESSTDMMKFGHLAVSAFTYVSRGLSTITAPIRQFLTGIAYVVKAAVALFEGFSFSWRGVVNGFLQGILTLVQGSLNVLRVPLKLMGKSALVESWSASLDVTKAGLTRWAAPTPGPVTGGMSVEPSAPPLAGPMSMPGGIETPFQSPNPALAAGVSSVENEATLKEIRDLLKRQGAANVYLDGAKVGHVLQSVDRADAQQSFDPGLSLVSE